MIKITKYLLFQLPEFYLITIILLVGYCSPFSFTPFVIVVAFIILLQIIFKNRISGIILASLLFLLNLYFLDVLLSEFKEFEAFNMNTERMLIVGIPLWLSNMSVSGVMFYKYSKRF